YFYRQKEQTHYVFIYERELQKWVKTWHEARVKSGGLVEIGSHAGVKLYRVIPEKDVPAEEGIKQWRRGQRPAPRTQPSPRRPTKPEPTDDDRLPDLDAAADDPTPAR